MRNREHKEECRHIPLSVLQCVAVCCSVLCSVLQCVAVCCSHAREMLHMCVTHVEVMI